MEEQTNVVGLRDKEKKWSGLASGLGEADVQGC